MYDAKKQEANGLDQNGNEESFSRVLLVISPRWIWIRACWLHFTDDCVCVWLFLEMVDISSASFALSSSAVTLCTRALYSISENLREISLTSQDTGVPFILPVCNSRLSQLILRPIDPFRDAENSLFKRFRSFFQNDVHILFNILSFT